MYAVKSSQDSLLDVARETWREGIEDIMSYTSDLERRHSITIEVAFTQATGHIMRTFKDDLPRDGLPKVFTNVTTKGKKLEFSSLELKKLNTRLKQSMDEILLKSNAVLRRVFSFARQRIAGLYHVAESLALLDMLAGFGQVAQRYEYVRPEFGETLAIQAGRHPLHERFRAADGVFVPNDTFASEACSFQLVTGPNMSGQSELRRSLVSRTYEEANPFPVTGKSTFLRQVALLHVMAQCGSFVPAEMCHIKICDALLSRLGNDDSIEEGLSTFGKEMATMAMILSTLSTTDHALVIVDELGRGTSPEEGVGIAHAISARLIAHKATVLFATHFKELSVTLSRFPNVVTYHLHAETDRSKAENSLTFSHRVRPGVTPLSHYGLELVKSAKLPSDVLATAATVSQRLDDLERDGKEKLAGSTVVMRRKALIEVSLPSGNCVHSAV